MEEREKKDLYKTSLKRETAYIVFMAACETDLSLLPQPITRTEKRLYELCKERSIALTFVPSQGDAPNGPCESEADEVEQNQDEEEKSATKKPAAKRTASKKASGK